MFLQTQRDLDSKFDFLIIDVDVIEDQIENNDHEQLHDRKMGNLVKEETDKAWKEIYKTIN